MGPKAGQQLRSAAAKSLMYAVAFIMVYVAFINVIIVRVPSCGFRLRTISRVPLSQHFRLTMCLRANRVMLEEEFVGIDSPSRKPRFVRNFMAEAGDCAEAVRRYVGAVKDRSYPAPEHCFG